MLEKSTLLLRPWTTAPSGEPGVRVRAVDDAAGNPLGFIRHVPVRGPRWLRWLVGRTLEAYEWPDSSLVFCLHRSWGWSGAWHVVDADGRLVGKISRRKLLDGFGSFLAVFESLDGIGSGRCLTMDGFELGDYSVADNGTRVTFAADMEGNPFAKMMLLSGVLVQT
jgi:hypothetical protein